jgi:hypothetical protein
MGIWCYHGFTLRVYILGPPHAVANLADNMIGVIKSSFAISYKFL